ncbi:hypothetical protein MMC21_005759 [Puttea exsequens]|nr:hypothetical protein [Puttea exsequens]
MAKFSNAEDSGYRSVLGELRRWVKAVQRASNNPSHLSEFYHSSDQDPEANDRDLECYRALYTSQYKEHKDEIPTRAQGTCNWFLGSEQYHSWLESRQTKVLWITADPGYGKSVLAKFLIDQELPKSKAVTVCFFFFKKDAFEQSNVLSALCAILHQLFSRHRALLKHAMTDFLQVGRSLSQSVRRLWDILVRAAKDAAPRKIICVLDALDECQEASLKQLIQLMVELCCRANTSQVTTGNLRFLITSRHYQYLQRGISRIGPSVSSIHASGSTAIMAEINHFIKEEVQNIGRELSLEDSVRQELEDKLKETGNRTYLWLHLIMNEIRESMGVSHSLGLQRIISTLPISVYSAYEKILRRASDPKRAVDILRIILCSHRPLTVGELNRALAVEDTQAREPEEDDDHFKLTIRNQCGLFITIAESNRVYLIHRTAKDFLEDNVPASAQDQSLGFFKMWGLPLDERDSHRFLARKCIHYLSTGAWFGTLSENEKRSPVLLQPENVPFLHYAAFNWSRHVLEGSEERLDFETLQLLSQGPKIDFLFRLLWLDETSWSYWTSGYRVPSHTPAILAASFLGLEKAAFALIKDRTALNSRSDGGSTALHWATWKYKPSIVRLLLEAGLNPKLEDEEGNNSLHIAALKGHIEFVDQLLDHGVSVDAQNNAGHTALHLAATNGHNQIVERLLHKGANVLISDIQNRTVLHHAIDNKRFGRDVEIIRLLLKHGISEQEPDIDNMTPLHLAVQCSADDVAELLLDNGFSIDVTIERKNWLAQTRNGSIYYTLHGSSGPFLRQDASHAGYTPLHAAALFGNADMVKFLLQRGANPNAQGKEGETPLHLALRRWIAKRKLMDAWTDPKNRLEGALDMIVDDYNDDNSETYHRVHKMRSDTVNMLLDSPRYDVSIQDDRGETCLHAIHYGDCDASEHAAKLLQRGADLDIRNRKGETAVHLAVRAADHQSLNKFLRYQADPHTTDNCGQNLLHHACASRQYTGREQTISTLLGHSAASALVSSTDSQGRNCLHHQVLNLPDVNIVRILLAQGVNVNQADNQGHSPLVGAIMSGLFNFPKDTIPILLQAGADPRVSDAAGRNLAHLAISQDECAETSVLELFADYGVKIDAVDTKGRTVLHHAAIAGTLNRRLLHDITERWGVDVNIRDRDNSTALDHAVIESGMPRHPLLFDEDRWRRARELLREVDAHETIS